MLKIEDRNDHAKLENLTTSVTPDGMMATYQCKFTDQPLVQVSLPLCGISGVMASLSEAATEMVRRRALQLDQFTINRHMDTETAVHTTGAYVFVEPATQQRVLIFHAEDGRSIPIKLNPFDAYLLQERLSQVSRRLAN